MIVVVIFFLDFFNCEKKPPAAVLLLYGFENLSAVTFTVHIVIDREIEYIAEIEIVHDIQKANSSFTIEAAEKIDVTRPDIGVDKVFVMSRRQRRMCMIRKPLKT